MRPPGILSIPYGKATIWGIDKALVENVSLGQVALILGTARPAHLSALLPPCPSQGRAQLGLPWAIALIGSFYVMKPSSASVRRR